MANDQTKTLHIIAAVIYFILAAIGVLGLIGVVIGGIAGAKIGLFSGLFGVIGALFWAILLFLLIFTVLYIAIGIGILKEQEWARITAIVLSVLGILIGLGELFKSPVSGIIWLVGSIFIIWALSKK